MTAHDQVRIILRNIEAMGKPYPDFVLVGKTKPYYEAPEPPKHLPPKALYFATVGGGVSIILTSAWVSLSLHLIDQL